MKVELQLITDTDNSYCEDNSVIITFHDDEEERVWIELDGRTVSVDKTEFKKLLSII